VYPFGRLRINALVYMQGNRGYFKGSVLGLPGPDQLRVKMGIISVALLAAVLVSIRSHQGDWGSDRANLLNYLTISFKTDRYSALERLFYPQNGHCKSLQFTNGFAPPLVP